LTRVGYQGEVYSYSHQVATELFGDRELHGFTSFSAAFSAIRDGEVDLLVLPIENSTTGSVLPVLNRLVTGSFHIIAEHMKVASHGLLGLKGAELSEIRRVFSHPEALSQAERTISRRGWEAVPVHDTAGAVRIVADEGDPHQAALAHVSASALGLAVLLEDVVDRADNTTRFVVLAPGEASVPDNANKTSVVFEVLHRPGSLALALTELAARGANLTRIESRPSTEAWRYRFFVDLVHSPGPEGLSKVFNPDLVTVSNLRMLGSYRVAK
jgi:prephenate dehydratase